jgi:hypothetical protein
MAILTCSGVSGAAEANDAMAVANAPARAAELTIDFADISLISLIGDSAVQMRDRSSILQVALLRRPDHTNS